MYEKLAQIVAQIAGDSGRIGASGYSNIGMVIGGTSPEATTALRQKYPNCGSWFPGTVRRAPRPPIACGSANPTEPVR